MTAILRTIAIVVAVAAAVDPAISANRPRPVAVELITGAGAQAKQVRERLIEELGDAIGVARAGEGDAVVLIDGRADLGSIREKVTVSAVTSSHGAPNLRLVGARAPSLLLPGETAAIEVDADVVGLAGRKSVVTVTQNGVEIGRAEHPWSAQRRQRLLVPFVTTIAGTSVVRIGTRPFEDETGQDDNTLEARVLTVDRPLRVAFVEPRPSWTAGFIRRVLEADPAFDVTSVVRPTRGIEVRTGAAPAALSILGSTAATALDRFDVLLVGAPEELRPADLESLRTFMADRGGTVVFLPDRRPTGPYAAFVSSAGFDEVLLDAPVTLESSAAARPPRASELAIPKAPSTALRALAALYDGRPAIASWPVGDGALLFSGALDSWRFRAEDDDRFATFWRASIASAALAAPPAVQVETQPEVVRPGSESHAIVRVRRTEFERSSGGELRIPAVRALLLRKQERTTTTEVIRLWPTTESGVFEGRFTSSRSGTDSIQVSAGSAEGSALVVRGASEGDLRGDDEEAELLATTTGGGVGTAENLAPIVNHLRSLARKQVAAQLHPMRSGWWIVPFALALCAEWTLRRRRGER
jgi:hypothetical protein